MAGIEFIQVTVRSGRTVRLHDVTVSIPDGEFVAVVGGSGSGKSTVLRTIAGLDRVASGVVRMNGRDVTGAAPGERDVAMVFQRSALIGHLDVRRNVSFPLDVRRHDAADIRRRVDAETRALHIEDLLERAPAQLSAGEQQMVQIARALVRVPTVLLLDEPFSSLDDTLRRRMRSEISMLQAGYGVTTVMATNDVDDVRALSSMVVVLDEGRLVQSGPTATVYRSPSTLLAAIVTGPLSQLEMTVVADRSGFWLLREDPAGGELVRLRVWQPGLTSYVGDTVVVAVRPDDVVIVDHGAVPAVVSRVLPAQFGGVQCSVAGAHVTVMSAPGAPPSIGDAVRLRVDHPMLFDRVTGAAIV